NRLRRYRYNLSFSFGDWIHVLFLIESMDTTFIVFLREEVLVYIDFLKIALEKYRKCNVSKKGLTINTGS
ncbi:hypothetical protein, partial [Neobacillus cucumis]|uniref:hypothetical protein n=1 Tax=Neobacillus cucumis TaxID=1740721 RepID=UPI002E1A3CF6|nr:hypothetical protein [Neobacillus cucumis]